MSTVTRRGRRQPGSLGRTAMALVVAAGLVACGPSGTSEAPADGLASPTSAVPGPVPTWTSLPPPTATAEAIATPEPTATPEPEEAACTPDARFAADITIPDGTVIQAGERFTKTWALLNTGTCTWGEGYYLNYAGENQMGAPDRVPVPATAPGDEAQISVELTAPGAAGQHRSDWQLSRGDERFGSVVWLLIRVD